MGMNSIKYVLALAAVFLFIFAPRFNVAGGVSGGMLAVLLVLVVALTARRRLTLPRPLLPILAIFLFFALYSAVLAEFFGNNPSYFVSICISVAVSLFFSWFFAELLLANGVLESDLLYAVVRICAYAIFANSLIIILEYVVPNMKGAVESLLYQDMGANINYADHAFRLRGIASSGGAGLSIVNALGVLLIAFLVFKRQLHALAGTAFSLVIVASNVFTGRTGLIFGILFLLILLGIILARNVRAGAAGIGYVILFFLTAPFLVKAIFNFELDPEIANWAFEWVDGLMSGEISSSSSDDLGTMLFLPDHVGHLLFGIGYFEGEGAIYPRSDSGYVKTIMTIGCLGGAVFYGVIAYMLLRMRKMESNFSLLVFSILIFMFVVEIKEPFLYQNFAARVIAMFSGAAMFLISRQHDARASYYRRA